MLLEIFTFLHSIDLRLEYNLIHKMESEGWKLTKTEKPRILTKKYSFSKII